MKTCLPVLLLLFILHPVLQSRVLRIEIDTREIVLNGKSFGEIGAYELIKGRIYFGIDPSSPYNQRITDLDLAPRNANGLVEAWSDLVVLQPADQEKARGIALVEVSNRGGKFSPSYFNRAGKSLELDPADPAYWGDGLLMRQGLTVIWIGWEFDVPEGEHLLRLNVPQAVNADGSPIEGWVRSDWTVDEKAAILSIGHRDQVPYPAIDLSAETHRLTVRDGRDAPRLPIPRDQWQFAQFRDGRQVVSDRHIMLNGGFEPGRIYELVYRAANPALVGLGLAAIRDVISYAKYARDCPFPVKKGIAAGVSQTGRFLRHFLYQGFNTDEDARPAYDGLMIITAGAGRGSFNHRFAQPSRDAHRYSAFFYPTDLFPFSSREQTDPVTGQTDGLLSHLFHQEHAPKTFFINTGYEYWGRAASLIHLSPDGAGDIAPLGQERIYHIASGQHFVDRFPPDRVIPAEGSRIYPGNPLEFKVNYRALLVRLVEWVDTGVSPPDSRYPRLEDGTLVFKEKLAFPSIPGVIKPSVIHNAYRADYGTGWKEGIVDLQPPRLGYAFPSLVPQVDSLGNETGGIRNAELLVPLATYTPWSLRTGAPGGVHELTDFKGYLIPLPINRAEREIKKDPRPAISDLYPSATEYFQQIAGAAASLIREGFLLPEDSSYVRERAGEYWEWIHQDPYAGLTEGPQQGTLMIIGGGQLDKSFFEEFKKLAGGPNAEIVVIPSAGSDSYLTTANVMEGIKKDFLERGFKKVTVLHTRSREEADSEAFTAPIRRAGGVWISGGRQWRLADAYLDTRTHEALRELLQRNGVIAGTSAGATIQGSYLARGDTKSNLTIMGDHEKGMGFIRNIAIDQHLLARNRQFDLLELREKHPEILGIGLDENTGILVRGNTFEVIGAGYIAVYEGKMWSPQYGPGAYIRNSEANSRFYLLKKGQKYNMWERRVIE